MSFRDTLDPSLKEHFEELVQEVAKEKNAYKESQKDQLWVALAVLAKRISNIELQINRSNTKVSKKRSAKLKKALKKL
jgi:hypothetical protein